MLLTSISSLASSSSISTTEESRKTATSGSLSSLRLLGGPGYIIKKAKGADDCPYGEIKGKDEISLGELKCIQDGVRTWEVRLGKWPVSGRT